MDFDMPAIFGNPGKKVQVLRKYLISRRFTRNFITKYSYFEKKIRPNASFVNENALNLQCSKLETFTFIDITYYTAKEQLFKIPAE